MVGLTYIIISLSDGRIGRLGDDLFPGPPISAGNDRGHNFDLSLDKQALRYDYTVRWLKKM